VIAVDTNVIVRFLTGDDPGQLERAKALFASETILIPKTVMLESGGVLRKLYKIGRTETLNALSGLAALPNVRCEDGTALAAAFAWAHQGVDFADALHLASARGADRFATFDEDFVKRGSGAGVYAL
jgi:predicted nucleic acid-binding protein